MITEIFYFIEFNNPPIFEKNNGFWAVVDISQNFLRLDFNNSCTKVTHTSFEPLKIIPQILLKGSTQCAGILRKFLFNHTFQFLKDTNWKYSNKNMF